MRALQGLRLAARVGAAIEQAGPSCSVGLWGASSCTAPSSSAATARYASCAYAATSRSQGGFTFGSLSLQTPRFYSSDSKDDSKKTVAGVPQDDLDFMKGFETPEDYRVAMAAKGDDEAMEGDGEFDPEDAPLDEGVGEDEYDYEDDELGPSYAAALQGSTYEERMVALIEELRNAPRGKLKQRMQQLLKNDELLTPEELAAEEQAKVHVPHAEEFCMQLVDMRMCAGRGKMGGFYYSAMVVVGNLNGMTGYAIGKSKEPNMAVAKGTREAIRNAIYVPLYRGHTLYAPVTHTFKRTKLIIMPRFRGFGLVAHPMLTELCELIGVRDMSAKVHGSRNLRNVIKCFFEAITSVTPPIEQAKREGTYMREVCTSRV